MKVRDELSGEVFEAQSVRRMCDHRSKSIEDRRAWALRPDGQWTPVEVLP